MPLTGAVTKWLGLRSRYKQKRLSIALSLFCLYSEDYLFSNQFMEDLGRIYSLRKYFPSFDDMEKTEGWDSQPFGSVFASTSDTPISSVVTADFLYLTKADSCVRSHFDKHRVNHLDSHPDLSAMSSPNHGWLFCSVKNYWKEVVGIVPDVLRYATPLLGLG